MKLFVTWSISPIPTIESGTMSGISVVFRSVQPPTAVPMSATAKMSDSISISVFCRLSYLYIDSVFWD